jgi:enoyl-CoA hydratase/carnithine racemase
VCLRLYTFPKPTVAAITGHAVAGGCILALCCDYRLIAEGKKLMGLNEIKLGVPVPYLADCVLQGIVGTRCARDMMDTGEFYVPADALRMGLVDAVFPVGDVLPKAVEKARLLGAWPPPAFALIKRNRVEQIEQRVMARREEKERLFVDCWYSEEARQRLKEAIEKF